MIPKSYKSRKLVSVLHHLDFLIPTTSHILNIVSSFCNAGAHHVLLNRRFAVAVNIWRQLSWTPVRDEANARWLQLKVDQETSALVQTTVDKQLEHWQQWKDEIDYALRKFSSAGLNGAGHRLRTALFAEMNKSQELETRIESSWGHNCTSPLAVEYELKSKCSLAAQDWEQIRTYNAALKRHNETIYRVTQGLEELLAVATPVENIMQSLVSGEVPGLVILSLTL